MTVDETDAQKIINLLTDILNETKKGNKELEDLKNLFLRYDLEAQMDEMGDIPED